MNSSTMVLNSSLFCLVSFLIVFQTQLILAERSIYIVHMNTHVMPTNFDSHHEWYLDTIYSLEANDARNDQPKLLYCYNHTISGFSVLLSPQELLELETMPGFISAYLDKVVTHDTTYSSKFLSLNTKFGLWPNSKYGKDVIVGVIDSGIWPESRSFDDHGMTEVPSRWKGECEMAEDFNSSLCNKKLIGARYFEKGAYASNIPVRSSPRDEEGHGTHTSSTVAGNFVEGVSFFGYGKGTARGIAPRARIAMYKVSSVVGLTSDILAAMDKALEDGVDIISISMGRYGLPLLEDPIAIAAFAAIERGVLVSASAGNDGPDTMSLHNGAPWLVTVGASTTNRRFSATLILGNEITITGWSQFPAKALLVDLPLVYNESLLPCDSARLLSVTYGSIVVCSDEFGFLVNQIAQVTSSKAAGAIFITNDLRYEEVGDLPCPGLLIKPIDSWVLVNYVKSTAKPIATMKFQQDLIGTRPAPTVSHYSSRGPSLSYPGILKPDLVAPGTKIVAAWIPTVPAATLGSNLALQSEYMAMSGTSMACPHVSGVAALLKSVYPDWSPAAIRSAMMTTADALDNTGDPIKDVGDSYRVASPLAMGSGNVNPNKALDPGLIYDANAEDYINLLCSLNYTRKQLQTITRTSAFNCSNKSSDLNYPSFIAFFNSNENSSDTTMVQEFRRTVTNVGNAKSNYTVTLSSMNGFEVVVMPHTDTH